VVNIFTYNKRRVNFLKKDKSLKKNFMKDFVNEIIDDLTNDEKLDSYEEVEEREDNDIITKKKSLRHYWVEILLCIMCLCYLYYISSSIYNYTFLGFSLGRTVSQALVFILPFVGLWLFYRVNKTRKVESNIRDNSTNGITKNLLIAMQQNGRCAKCNNVLGNDFMLEKEKVNGKAGKSGKELAMCGNCYDRKCLNNSLYKTLRDF